MSYAIFMTLAFVSAGLATRLAPHPLPLTQAQRWFIALAGFCGAMLAAKLPFWILSAETLNHAGSLTVSGKSVLFGLVGGYAGVEVAKKYLRIRTKTGDNFVVPVAIGIGIGRMGCFFGGCCYGTPTELPWGVVFSSVDNFARHPIQIYEAFFHLTAAGVFYSLRQQRKFPGQLIKLYFLSYFGFRFLTEFIRPEIELAYGLTAYQWAIVFFVILFFVLLYRDSRTSERTENGND